MARLTEIVKQPWNDNDIFADSIPHLLHWDFAYLWILQRPETVQPLTWKTRVSGWRKLLALFLLGKLERQDEPVHPPFSMFLQKTGLTSLGRLILNGQPVGILSPTVLVRPLPDASDEDLRRLPDQTNSPELAYFSGVLQERLGSTPQTGVRRVLQEIVARYFGRPGQAANFNGSEMQLWLVPEMRWDLEAQPEQFSVMVNAGATYNTFVPRCSHCAKLLLRAPLDPALQPINGVLSLSCSLGHENNIALEKFMIWERQSDVVVWTDRTVPIAGSQPPVPPSAYLEGPEIRFTWNPGLLGGEGTSTTIRLVFPGKQFVQASYRDTVFTKLLLPGVDVRAFQGLPFKPEWLGAVTNPDKIEREVTEGTAHFRNVKLLGWPFPFTFSFGNLSLQREASLAAGIFPAPMHAGWKRYRVFAAGPGNYRAGLVGEPGRDSIVDTYKGWPNAVCVEDTRREAGATWFLRKNLPEATQHPNIYVGVDFGTTNSVLYFAPDGDEAPQPVTPSDFHLDVYWLSRPAENPESGWFLPPSSRVGENDASLVPSTLWNLENTSRLLIRWNDRLPELAKAVHGFKWDRASAKYQRERSEFLDELLFLSIPHILRRLDVPNSAPNLHLGFAYPLAFSYESRRAIATLLEQVRTHIREQTGCTTDVYSTNESIACVRAFGLHNPNDTFLVADMGGVTMDVALCRFGPERANECLQVGSLHFGGETYAESIALMQAHAENEREPEYWRIRDAISGSRVNQVFPNDTRITDLVDRFLPMALEYLRTMLAAHKQIEPDEKINVLLVGNGWRLAELTGPPGQARSQVFRAYYTKKIEAFGLSNVRLYDREIPGLAWSKHLVAFGALQNVRGIGARKENELSEQPFPTRLPAGRRVVITSAGGKLDLGWDNMVGDGVPLDQPAAELRAGSIGFDLNAGPDEPAAWKPWLKKALPTPIYPDEPQLRQSLANGIAGSTFLMKGPLQIILESHWKRSLGGSG